LVHEEVWEFWEFFQQKLIFAVLCTALGVYRSWHRIWVHYRTAMCITYFGMLYYSSFIWKNPVVRKCTKQILCPWWNWTIFQFLVLKKQKKTNGMSSFGYFGRFFETTHTAWWSTLQKNSSKKILKKKIH
jgi:hypothetical protein